jgi:hypothetical protein
MRKVLTMAGVAVVLTLGWSVSLPERAAAAQAGSVCQFYRGEPLCKTVQESYCIGGSAGLEAKTCRTTTEYWYWS